MAEIRGLVRHARRLARVPTASRRATPDFVIIGAQKAGTTSLWRWLAQHPRIAPGLQKEVHFFDHAFERGPQWYRVHFPLEIALRRSRSITGEATPSYLFHPHVPERLAKELPDAKLIALLREPAARAYSHYRMARRRGLEPLTFEAAIREEDARLAADRARLDEGRRPSSAYYDLSYVSRGLYGEQLDHWFRYVDPARLLVLDSRDLADRPAETYRRAVEFLELDTPPAPPEFKSYNTAKAEPAEVPAAARALLEARFAESNARVAALTGIDFRVAHP